MRFSLRQSSKRDARGSMLFLCIAVLAVILMIVGTAFAFYFVYFSHKNLQSWSEDLALDCAHQLNENDHGGKLNNLLGHSRELVFTSRENFYKAGSDEFRGVQGLSAQVLEQSREGAKLLADERKKYIGVSLKKIRTSVEATESSRAKNLIFACMSAAKPQVAELRIGNLEQVASNVETSSGVPNLHFYDKQKNYIKSGTLIDLYKSNVNLKLPGEDADLDFELASFPAPVKGVSAPIRLSRGHGFRQTGTLRTGGADSADICNLMPSAVQVVMTSNVKQNVVASVESKTRTENTACASGAWVEP